MNDLHNNAYLAPQIEIIGMDEEVAVCQASRPNGYNGNNWEGGFIG